MNNRETLELAAKAAGLTGEYRFDGYGEGCFVALDGSRFNPLTDDGDALRLAVKLGILNMNNILNKYIVEEQKRHCRNVATRRAIVRAAAEIGKAMK